MIIIQVAGGLGNQLQQYALYRKFVSLGREARLDVSWFDEKNQEKMSAKRELELNYFDRLLYETCTAEEKAHLVGGEGLSGKLIRKLLTFTLHRFQESEMYHPQLLSMDNVYISGHFACEKYYADIMFSLQEKIQFPESKNPLNHEMAQEMRKRPSVSIHVRRGDYLDEENKKLFGGICTDSYYDCAVNMIREAVPDSHFYVFSDDIPYVKEKYQGNEFTIVDINHGRDSFYDMWLMSNCKHNICANSTFSFWGARLNKNENKIMVRPTIHKNSQSFIKREMEDLWKGWHFINPDGEVM